MTSRSHHQCLILGLETELNFSYVLYKQPLRGYSQTHHRLRQERLLAPGSSSEAGIEEESGFTESKATALGGQGTFTRHCGSVLIPRFGLPQVSLLPALGAK